jgi:hypothetical protein
LQRHFSAVGDAVVGNVRLLVVMVDMRAKTRSVREEIFYREKKHLQRKIVGDIRKERSIGQLIRRVAITAPASFCLFALIFTCIIHL